MTVSQKMWSRTLSIPPYVSASERSQPNRVPFVVIQKAIEDNAARAQDQEEYNRRYDELADRYEKLKKKLEKHEQERDDREHKSNVLTGFLFEMKELEYLDT